MPTMKWWNKATNLDYPELDFDVSFLFRLLGNLEDTEKTETIILKTLIRLLRIHAFCFTI